jgi:D-sedoheptulose 7-phosphate isomerase
MTIGALARRAGRDRARQSGARQDGVVTTGHADRIALVQRTLEDAARVHDVLRDEAEAIVAAADLCSAAIAAGHAVYVFGNGGSAAEAQHFATELSGRFLLERRALPAVALTTDSSALTAIANDYGFERVFERQIEALGRPGDVAVAISTSGTSPNVACGLRAAQARGLGTIALTGPAAGELGDADVRIAVNGPSTPRVQEGQLTVLHAICDLVERDVVQADRG